MNRLKALVRVQVLDRAQRQRALHLMAASVLCVAATMVAVSAFAQGTAPSGALAPHHGHSMRPGPGPMFGFGPPQRVERLLKQVNASEAQQTQVRQILDAAVADLKGQRAAEKALREKALALFTAPSVDAAAAESLRQQQQTLHDDASRRMLQAMLDVSRVLTPEQRVMIGERLQGPARRMEQRGAAPKDKP